MTRIHLEGDYETRKVLMNGKPLTPERSQKLRNHSPDGFSWGYSGSGCAQFALAVMLELTDEEPALKRYQTFKEEQIATLDHADFNVEIDVSPYVRD